MNQRTNHRHRRRPVFYILDEHNQALPSTADQAELQLRDPSRRTVGSDYYAAATVHIWTVFMAMDLAYTGEPLLFESHILGGPMAGFCRRYPTYEAARQGHAELVQTLNWMVGP